MSHNEFKLSVGTLHNLLRELERAEKASYYNVEKEAGQSIERAIMSLQEAVEAQEYLAALCV